MAEIKITGRRTIRAYNKADADHANEQSSLEVVTQGDRVFVRTNLERVSAERQVSMDLEVTVPRARLRALVDGGSPSRSSQRRFSPTPCG